MTAALLLAVAAAAPTGRTLVLDFKLDQEVDKTLASYLTQVLAQEIADRTGVVPMVGADLRALIGLEMEKQLMGCGEDQCITELAGALNAERIVYGTVAALPGQWMLTVSLVDSTRSQPLGRAVETCARNQTAVVKAARLAASKIFGGPAPVDRPAPPSAPPAPSGAAPFALMFVPFGVGQLASDSPGLGALFLASEILAFGVSAAALAKFESDKLPGSGGVLQGGQFADPAAADRWQSTYLLSFWVGVGLAALGVGEAVWSY